MSNQNEHATASTVTVEIAVGVNAVGSWFAYGLNGHGFGDSSAVVMSRQPGSVLHRVALKIATPQAIHAESEAVENGAELKSASKNWSYVYRDGELLIIRRRSHGKLRGLTE